MTRRMPRASSSSTRSGCASWRSEIAGTLEAADPARSARIFSTAVEAANMLRRIWPNDGVRESCPPLSGHLWITLAFLSCATHLRSAAFGHRDGEPTGSWKGETPEKKRKAEPDRRGGDARSSVGKHASGSLRTESGEPQMQRKARSRGSVSSDPEAAYESHASAWRTDAAEGKSWSRLRNRQGVGEGLRTGTDPLTGPARRRGTPGDDCLLF